MSVVSECLLTLLGFFVVAGFFLIPAIILIICLYILYRLVKTRLILARDHVLFRVCLIVQIIITFSYVETLTVHLLPPVFKQVFPIAVLLAIIVSVIKFLISIRHRQAFVEEKILKQTRYILYLWIVWIVSFALMATLELYL